MTRRPTPLDAARDPSDARPAPMPVPMSAPMEEARHGDRDPIPARRDEGEIRTTIGLNSAGKSCSVDRPLLIQN